MASVDGDAPDILNVQIFVPDFNLQKCLQVHCDETVWAIKQRLLGSLPKDVSEGFNYGLFLPPCNGRAGKFLQEERHFRDYPFQDCVPYLELKYKKRVYKMLTMDEKALKALHSKSNLKKFVECVAARNVDKVEKLLAAGLDPNFHDAAGETPLTAAAAVPDNKKLLLALVAGGAHMDFRNSDGQTALHKAAFLPAPTNVQTLLELSASPNLRDSIGLTPLYYNMIRPESSPDSAELMLRDYALVGVTDPTGNHEIHQAVKNGLKRHLEHLLYYGAELDAANRNGNTPLHVAAVNNQPEAARILLFRGATPDSVNTQGQSAYHVALICGHHAVAEVIKNHDPSSTVPYRGSPAYNSKRKLTLSAGRRRSASQSDRSLSRLTLGSSSSIGLPSPTPSNASTLVPTGDPLRSHDPSQTLPSSLRPAVVRGMRSTAAAGNGGTLPAKAARPHFPSPANPDVNIARILVIPRGPKGFGFILRGARKLEEGVDFEPSPTVPALQFFEGVDMNGMAIKADLKPGDFLLQINGVDVRRARHEEVVELINKSGDTITLKVVTVKAAPATAAPHSYGTLQNHSRRHRHGNTMVMGLPPAIPKRHPSTSLSAATGRHFHQQPFPSHYGGAEYVPGVLSPAKSMEALGGIMRDGDKVASIRGRSSSRRISAAELEQLMARQSNSSAELDISISSDVSGGSGRGRGEGPRVYASVAEMKKAKRDAARGYPPQPPQTGLPRSSTRLVLEEVDTRNYFLSGGLKSFHSSPDLVKEENPYGASAAHRRPAPPPPGPAYYSKQSSEEVYGTPNGRSLRRVSNSNDYDPGDPYSQPFKPTSRPKTPPPPPPPPGPTTTAPPPPPPPPPDLLAKPPSKASNSGGADCRGITAAALTNVKLKSAGGPPPQRPVFTAGDSTSKAGGISAAALSAVKLKPKQGGDSSNGSTTPTEGSLSRPKMDFDSDLKAALAKRRSNMAPLIPPTSEPKMTPLRPETKGKLPPPPPPAGRLGLSLKESVHQSGLRSHKGGAASHSPPMGPGFAGKKDSGYTSSRNSLEPSECGDEVLRERGALATVPDLSPASPDFPAPPPPEFLQASLNASGHEASLNRVSMLSQQLEDAIVPSSSKRSSPPPPTTSGGRGVDSVSMSSTLSTLSGCSGSGTSADYPRQPAVPPPDYDSGTGDSDHEAAEAKPLSGGGVWRSKAPGNWGVGDVCDWLAAEGLGEYRAAFSRGGVEGRALLGFRRADFTALGLTRIAHRVHLEKALKRLATPTH